MKPELSIQVIYEDVNLIEFRISASNGKYAGAVNVYADNGEILIDLGKRLLGFPKRTKQNELIEFGATEEYMKSVRELQKTHPETLALTSYVKLEFDCLDPRLSHPFVKIDIHEAPKDEVREAPVAKVYLELYFEPLQVDDFARSLIGIGEKRGGIAILQGYE